MNGRHYYIRRRNAATPFNDGDEYISYRPRGDYAEALDGVFTRRTIHLFAALRYVGSSEYARDARPHAAVYASSPLLISPA